MDKIWLCFVAVTALAWPVWAQKVEVQKPVRGQILHVQTALNHLTVLEMNEPVSTVAVGSPEFKVEWRDTKVFIQPTEPGVATNLFVWTASGRFNYELDPAGSVPQMDFVIDRTVSESPTAALSLSRPGEPRDPSPAEVLLEAKPVRLYGTISEKNRVAVYVTDVLEHEGQVFIRYTIRNQSPKAYVPGAPQVVALKAPWYRESLYPLSNTQLSPDAAAHLKCRGETLIEVAKGEIRSPRLDPGQETNGIVALKLTPIRPKPTVLRLTFLGTPNGPISATVVL